jgi:salicylate hydroxylase
MSSRCKIAIVGGGLAGLVAAHALRTFGMKAEIFEAAALLGEIGAAVTVTPQAAKVLQAVGVGAQALWRTHRSERTRAICKPASLSN